MAEYVVVDKAKLNGDLETIGNAIRTQTEKTAKLHFPEELEREILSIVKAKPEQEKTVEITENGTVEVTPDLGKVLSKIIANVNVASSGGGGFEIEGYRVVSGSFTPSVDVTSGEFEIGTFEATDNERTKMSYYCFAENGEFIKGSNTLLCTFRGYNVQIDGGYGCGIYASYNLSSYRTTKEYEGYFVARPTEIENKYNLVLYGIDGVTLKAGYTYKYILLFPKGV